LRKNNQLVECRQIRSFHNTYNRLLRYTASLLDFNGTTVPAILDNPEKNFLTTGVCPPQHEV
jgi:hypothetical protein